MQLESYLGTSKYDSDFPLGTNLSGTDLNSFSWPLGGGQDVRSNTHGWHIGNAAEPQQGYSESFDNKHNHGNSSASLCHDSSHGKRRFHIQFLQILP